MVEESKSMMLPQDDDMNLYSVDTEKVDLFLDWNENSSKRIPAQMAILATSEVKFNS